MSYATISGILKDSDGIAWKQATWTAVPVSPSSKPVFSDGTLVPTTSGNLDALGTFSGQVPNTLSILPPGSTLTFTITSLTSFAPLTLQKVQVIAANVDLGALLSPRLIAPRIQSGAINYAYGEVEIIKAKHGDGYVNTYEDQAYLFMQNTWIKIGAAPNFNAMTAQTATITDLTATDIKTATLEASGAITASDVSTATLETSGAASVGASLTVAGGVFAGVSNMANGTDLNTHQGAGIYYGTNLVNGPPSADTYQDTWCIIQSVAVGNWGFQLAIPYNTPAANYFFLRQMTGAAGAWVQFTAP